MIGAPGTKLIETENVKADRGRQGDRGTQHGRAKLQRYLTQTYIHDERKDLAKWSRKYGVGVCATTLHRPLGHKPASTCRRFGALLCRRCICSCWRSEELEVVYERRGVRSKLVKNSGDGRLRWGCHASENAAEPPPPQASDSTTVVLERF